MPSAHEKLIEELESTVANKSFGDRATMLHRVTDLFMGASGLLSKEQIALFDDVMGRLLAEIETSARVVFGRTLATAPDAPPQVVRMLALDDAIDVAGAILTHSERVDDLMLVEAAKTKSQAHLLAISRRNTLTEQVTDVLVERGDDRVALSTAENPNAAFSDFGYSNLVKRASNNKDLATRIWVRPDLPHQHLLKLFANASEVVQIKLMSEDPRRANAIREVVMQAAQMIQNRAREYSNDYATAYAYVRSLYVSDGLGESQLAEFAAAGHFDKTCIALSLICDLPIAMIERALVDEKSDKIIVIAKAASFAWETTESLLMLQSGTKNHPKHDVDRLFEVFKRLNVDTAKRAIQFYRLRERAMINQPASKTF